MKVLLSLISVLNQDGVSGTNALRVNHRGHRIERCENPLLAPYHRFGISLEEMRHRNRLFFDVRSVSDNLIQRWRIKEPELPSILGIARRGKAVHNTNITSTPSNH